MYKEDLKSISELIEEIKLNPMDYLDIYVDSGNSQNIGIIINSYVGSNEYKEDLFVEIEEIYEGINIYESDYSDVWLCFDIDFFDTGYINLGDQEIEKDNGDIIFYPENCGIEYIRTDDIYDKTVCYHNDYLICSLGDIVECSNSYAEMVDNDKINYSVLEEIYGKEILKFLELI